MSDIPQLQETIYSPNAPSPQPMFRTIYQTSRMVFPYAIYHFPFASIDSNDLFYDDTNDDMIANFFASVNDIKLLPELLKNNLSSVQSTSMANILENIWTGVGHTWTANDIMFRWLEILNKDEIQELIGYEWRTRDADKTKQRTITGILWTLSMLAGFYVMQLKSKLQKTFAQLNEVLQVWEYDPMNNQTWRAKLYQDFFTKPTGTDADLTKRIFQRLKAYLWEFPPMVTDFADKWIGYTEVPVFVEGESINQRIDIHFDDYGLSEFFTFTTGTDTQLITMLTNISDVFKQVSKITKGISYNRNQDDSADYKEFLSKYLPEELEIITDEGNPGWLLNWPKIKYPWQLFVIETHSSTGYKLKLPNISGDEIVTDSIFERDFSDNTDLNKYLKIRTLPGYTEDEMVATAIAGHYFRHLIAPNTTWGQELFNTPFSDCFAVFQALEIFDSSTQLSYTKGLTTPTLTGDNYTEDAIYSIFNATDNGIMAKPFLVEVVTIPNLTERTATPVTLSGTDVVATLSFADWMDKKYPILYINTVDINRSWAKRYVLMLLNPRQTGGEIKKQPEHSSKLSPETFQKSTDKDHLMVYIKDLENDIKWFNENDETNKAGEIKALVEKVQSRIKRLNEEENKPDKPKTDNNDRSKSEETRVKEEREADKADETAKTDEAQKDAEIKEEKKKEEENK